MVHTQVAFTNTQVIMGRSAFFASSVAVLAFIMIATNEASHHELCKGTMVNFTEIEYISLGECVKEYAPPPTGLGDGVTESSTSIQERIGKAKAHKCMEACFMVRKGMFTLDGHYNQTQSEHFIEEFPLDVRTALKESLAKCADKVKDKVLKLDNTECADFQEFIKCVDDDENKICERTD
ncbi:hypothetical protein Ocin01_03018 [Orchesella cincta]|uniref:Uncharacterized protein n=1 Tax=Orchesella cincta TaxID=48709 RepID=A0A1D2NEJ4_ORCCI|nr:hypothetical protein Ocin01_03018 [Orchesella cincta]